MEYDVKITDYALTQFDNILEYIVNRLMNPDAAARVMEDFDEAIEKLETAAGSFKPCEEEELAQRGAFRLPFEPRLSLGLRTS